MSPERVRSFVPLETALLPRPLHRFGRAFPPAVAELYLAAYAPDRGVILDPLAHPSSASEAARRTGRLGFGRSPHAMSSWAANVVQTAPEQDAVLAELAKVGASALAGQSHAIAMRALYGSRCGTCRAPVVVEAYLWDRDSMAPSKKAYRCSVCARDGKALLIEPTDPDDEERAVAEDARGLGYWQFVERFAEVERGLGETVAALFTPRNMGAVMGTLRAIETAVLDGPARDVLLLAFVEVLVTGNRLNAATGHGGSLRVEKGKARRGHAAHTREINVWLEFERTARELAAWLESNHGPRRGREFASPEDLPGKADVVLCEAPGPDDDLAGWAHVAAVLCLGAERSGIADSGSRPAAREHLMRVLRLALIDAHRRSRDDAPAIVYLPGAELATIAACALAGAGAGYRLRGVVYQRDALGPATRGDNAGAAAVLDFDRSLPLLRDQPAIDAPAIEDVIRRGVREAVVARGEPVGEEHAGIGALLKLAERGFLATLALARAGGTSELELFLDHFRSALGDAKRSELERVPHENADAPPTFTLAGGGSETTPLDDRVEWAVWGVLAAAREVETAALLKRSYSLFRDLETPDRELVERCIAAYGVQTADGRWRLREEDTLVRRQAAQSLVAARLIEVGRRLGFKAHVGRDLQRRAVPPSFGDGGSPGEALGDLMTAAERTADLSKFAHGPAEILDLIDVVWFGRGQMVFLWQIDWTARVQRSVVQLGESIPDDDRVFRFLAVADERRGLVGYKLMRSAQLAEAVRRRAWRFVKWGPLLRYAGDPAATLADLEGVLGLEPAVEQAGQQLAFKW